MDLRLRSTGTRGLGWPFSSSVEEASAKYSCVVRYEKKKRHYLHPWEPIVREIQISRRSKVLFFIGIIELN